MTATDEFTSWLNLKLKALKTDDEVFSSYIIGILEGDENEDEKNEGIGDILSEIVTSNTDEIKEEIFNKWRESNPQKNEEPPKKTISIDVNKHLADLLKAQTINNTLKEREYTDEERRIREQILAQYSQTEVEDVDAYDDPDDEDDKKTSGAASSGPSIERNTNAHDVQQLQKARREQQRLDSAAKKQKDKEDREKQKQLREEKKEKRKTVKGERRR